jgi:hypothetical protein
MKKIKYFNVIVVVLLFLLSAATAYAEESGKFKVGFALENTKILNLGDGSGMYGMRYGGLLGYSKVFGDQYWFSSGLKVLTGKGKGHGGRLDNDDTDVQVNALIGKIFLVGSLSITPYLGVGGHHRSLYYGGGRGYDQYNDLLLPLGAKAEMDFDFGKLGTDFTFEVVAFRGRNDQLRFGSGHSEEWLDGSHNAEFGIFFEPSAIPIGFRPYVRYEKVLKSETLSIIENKEITSGGLEIYAIF